MTTTEVIVICIAVSMGLVSFATLALAFMGLRDVATTRQIAVLTARKLELTEKNVELTAKVVELELIRSKGDRESD